MLQTNNNKIRRAFNLSAKRYDQCSSLHREIADRLVAQLTKDLKPSSLLDVGCGTGYLAGQLKEHFPQCRIIGLDFAQGMLEEASLKIDGINWVLGDCNQLPLANESFDAVVSNLAYQWSEDLWRSFAEARRVLLPQGVLGCTLFGFKTCQELFQSLDEASGGKLQFSRLPRKSQVQDALALSGFKDVIVESENLQVGFKDMQELMGWLKSIGANNISRDGYLGRELMSQAALIYRDKFSYSQGVGATFEVIKVYAQK